MFATFGFAYLLLSQDSTELLISGTGPHKRPVKIADGRAREFFDQGLNLLYAFNHGEAKHSFRAATRHDPNSAMAWWGLAMANGPHINNMMVMPEEEAEAVMALGKARDLLKTARAVDQDLIRATFSRFKMPQPADRGPLNVAFAREMGKLYAKYPSDADIGSLYAESMMDLRPWALWSKDYKPAPGTRTVISTLERVMAKSPNHPLALHLYIHAVEASPNPEKAVKPAERLRDLQPGLGHNVHMPSHIDVRVGDWRKAVISNEKAIKVDTEYRAKRPDQFVYRVYMAHNHHMLGFAAMMLGQKTKAIEAMDTMVANMPEDFQVAAAPLVDGFFAMPIEVRKRFGMWDEVLTMPDLPDRFPMSRTLRAAARSVAYAAKGMPKEARMEQAEFYALAKKVDPAGRFGQSAQVDIVRVAHHLMNGEILVAEDKMDRAVRELRLAAIAEDKLSFSEPPDWIQPTRHTLGAVLMKMGRYSEAAKVYQDELVQRPNNGWSLYGLAECQTKLGHRSAAATRKKFDAAWADAEIPITSSCLCLPGGK